MILEISKLYRTPAGCPVKLMRTVIARDEQRGMAMVKYVSPTNNYGYGEGTEVWFYESDLREWNVQIDGDPFQ